ncbi:type II secretion system protein F, partial [Escherichia coli]|nr:type II secretion system protein F [Escherichia coli]
MNADKYLAKLLFTTKLRLRFYEKMSRYLSNGIPVSFALNELYDFTTERGKKESTTSVVVRYVLRSVRNGSSFSEALTPWVPADELSILTAGEHAGKLSEAINNIVYINQTKKKIKSALFG